MALLAVLGAVLGGGAVLNNLLQSYPPYITGIARKTYQEMPNVLPPVVDLVAMRYRDVISAGQYATAAKELGLAGEWSEAVYESSRRLLDARDYVTAWWREEISEGELDTALGKLGLSDEDIGHFKKVTEFYPSPIDIVRFAVREVYKQSQVTKYGMDQDQDEEYFIAAAKAGLTRDRALDFWKAHWQLPSAGQGFEMLHRGEISMPELLDLLRALDVMPYWREKLTKIAYSPYTRVDVRRMHALGVLGEDALLQAYMDLGYDEDKAQHMVDFTLRYNSDETTGITRASLVSAYKKGIISGEELRSYLEGLGYTPDIVSFWIQMADWEKEQEAETERVNTLMLRYRVGDISKSELSAALGFGGVPSSYVDEQLRQLDSQDAQKLKMATKADLTDWLKAGIIDQDVYNKYMLNIGYRREDIIRYLTEIELETGPPEPKRLGIATYVRWLKKGIVTQDEFLDEAAAQNLSQQDIERYMLEALGGESET